MMRALLALLLLAMSVFAHADDVPACVGGQLPYQYEYYGIYGAGSTPEAACGALAKSVSTSLSGFVEAATNRCSMTSADENRSANPYVIVCGITATPPEDPASSPVSSEQYAGLMTILAAAFAVICFGLGFNSGWQA